MNIERLSALSARLRQYHGPFNLYYWEHCACGIAATMPEFNLVGFCLAPDDTWNSAHPVFQGKKCWDAVTEFFDISTLLSERMFDRAAYNYNYSVTPEMVANRIDLMVADYSAKTKAKTETVIEELV